MNPNGDCVLSGACLCEGLGKWCSSGWRHVKFSDTWLLILIQVPFLTTVRLLLCFTSYGNKSQQCLIKVRWNNHSNTKKHITGDILIITPWYPFHGFWMIRTSCCSWQRITLGPGAGRIRPHDGGHFGLIFHLRAYASKQKDRLELGPQRSPLKAIPHTRALTLGATCFCLPPWQWQLWEPNR